MDRLTSISDACPLNLCDGTGFLIFRKYEDNKRKGDFARGCQCQSLRKEKSLILQSNVPVDFQNVKVSFYDPALFSSEKDKQIAVNAKHIAIEYVKEFKSKELQGKGLYLYSKTKGCGKTHLSASIMNALIKKYKVSALYMTSVELLNRVKETFNSNEKGSAEQIKSELKKMEFVVLDDFAAEKSSEWTEEFFTDILNHRMIHNKMTIFTSNIPIEQLDHHYKNGRISSRVAKMAIQVEMPAEDIRKKQAATENKKVLEHFFNGDRL